MESGKPYARDLAKRMGPSPAAALGVEPDEDDMAGDDAAYQSAVSDLMAALKSGDSAGAASALKDAISSCKG